MASTNRPEKFFKFIIYFVIIVLLNIAGASLFFRIDLTENKMFSISDISKDVVSTLTEPMTINVFFTKDLPAPHNNTKRYLQDLLKEYEINSNDYFNYQFYDISSAAETTDESKRNKELAESYGVNPVQIRLVEQDEVKFKTAYMGLVLIHGDLIEKVPAIATVEGLEYKLTMSMKKLNNKISTLLGLKEKIKVELYMSSSLNAVAPYMDLSNLSKLPGKIEETINNINLKNYGRLEYKKYDPSLDNNLKELVEKYKIMELKWNDIDGGKVKAGEGGIGLVLKYQDKIIDIPVLNVMRIPIIGTRYELIDMESLDEIINGGIESLIDINEKIGYISDHGTLARSGGGMGGMMPQQRSELNTFNALISQGYSVKDFELKTEGVPTDINSLIIANPTENFSEFELYQIDQALMAGKNLAIFVDSFNEIQQQNQQFGMNRGPSFIPLNTGLEKLLKHYGVTINKSYVMDENCFKQQLPQQYGGGERAIYFAPLIQNKFINKELEFMNNIKGLISMRVSPLIVNEKTMTDHDITAQPLFSSSEQSWEMKGNINLNPMMIRPPSKDDEKESFSLAYLLEGSFPSYFDGKPLPEKEPEAPEGEDKNEKKEALPSIENKGSFIPKSKPVKIVIVASAEMLKDSMLDEEGVSPNATFIMNVIDAVNGKDGIAVMRSKKQTFNPLHKTDSMLRMAVKSFNIAGLPIIVVFFGLLVWLKRRSRRKNIQMIFQK